MYTLLQGRGVLSGCVRQVQRTATAQSPGAGAAALPRTRHRQHRKHRPQQQQHLFPSLPSFPSSFSPPLHSLHHSAAAAVQAGGQDSTSDVGLDLLCKQCGVGFRWTSGKRICSVCWTARVLERRYVTNSPHPLRFMLAREH